MRRRGASTESSLVIVKAIISELRGPPKRSAKGQLVRYGIVVGCGYVLAIAAYSAELAIGVPPYVGLGIAFVLNGLFNFALVRVWAFPPSGRGVRSDLTRFCLVAVVSFLVNYATFAILYSLAGLAATTSQRIGIIIAAPVTFLANRAWSFRARPQNPVSHEDDETPASARNESYSRM
jgi:putative flippase GtrA